MAKRGREGALKRQRERARQEKNAVKREKRQARVEDEPSTATEPDINEEGLMEEFAMLSERFENDQITSQQYDTERQRIFGELGIETDE